MRYNHRYHAKAKGTQQHRQRRLSSLLLLLAAFVLAAVVLKTPLDHRGFMLGFASSLYRVSAAYFISLFLALVLGLVTVINQTAENLLLPILDLAQSLPTFAILPVLIFYLGKSDLSVIIILVIAMIWPIMFSVISGVKEQRGDQVEAALIFGARGWKFLAYYRWPMLRPSVLTGSIVSWGQAWDTIVGAEIIAGVAGAGRYLGDLGQSGQTKLLFLGIVVYLFLIFGINQLIWLPLLHRYTKYQTES